MIWLEDFHRLQGWEYDERKVKKEDEFAAMSGQKYVPPRMGRAAYTERSLRMAERFQRMFLRGLRALRDLRRYAPTITIHNEGQVNIGQNQVNQAG